MDNNEIRRNILKILYETKLENPHGHPDHSFINEKLNITSNLLRFNIKYLEEKGYLKITWFSDGGFLADITSYGIDIAENNSELNQHFPISVTQNIVQSSSGVVINSTDVTINIHENFDHIYQQITANNPENPAEVKEMIEKIENELNKENLNKSKIQECFSWLKINASWTIPLLIQIITTTLKGS